MKHSSLYISAFLLPALWLACAPEKLSDKEILDSRPVTDLEVSYALDGAAVSALNFSHQAGTKTLDVLLNDENLVWNLVSNRDWCQVLTPSGKGPGKAVLKVSANDSFDARENATLTFVAGDYRGFQIPVTQRAAAFIISQSYFLSAKDGGEFTVKVTTRAGTDWNFSSDDFISVNASPSVGEGDYTTTTLTLRPSTNDGASRLGAVRLSSGEDTDALYLYQFGTDYAYDEAGRICLPGTQAGISLIVPEFAVSDVMVSSKNAFFEMAGPQDGFFTLTITLDENLSDCGEQREVKASLRLADNAASVVELPLILQDYIPANGLVTAKGFKAFAAAVAAGESTSDWETGGVVCVKSDIDMAGVEDWPGVGTASSPFTGKFDGGGHAVLNLTGSCGLFNYCKDAEVRDIALGKGSSLFNSIPFGRKGCLGGIVSQAENSLISGCSLVGAIDFAALSEEDDPLVYVGGIVGWADSGSRIEDAKVSGSVNVSSTGGSDVVCYLGGVAGLCEGTLAAANMLGAVSFSSGIAELHAGGVQGALAGGAVVQGNTFTGSLSLGGNASWAALGGLYGSLVASHSFDKGSDDSSSMGTIQINSYRAAATAAVYAGGFVGFVPGACSLALKGYAIQTNISMDFASAVRTAGYVCAGGFLGGCDPGYAAGPLEFDGLTSSGAITGKYSTAVACNVRRTWLGGIAGYLNGPSRLSACVNRGEVGKTEADDYCARSNSYGEVCGGIAGFVHGGDALFSACENHAGISEHLYNNNGVTGVYEGIFTPPVVGGILGAFNYFSAPENFTLTVNNCVNTKNIFGYRGYNGGIVGFCVNATVSGCENTGRLSNGANDQSAYRGGICGAAGNASILDCKATSDVFARVYGSADYGCGGGILGLVRGDAPVTLRGCSFFGTVQANKQSTDKPEYPGGIVGMGTDATTVADCRYGGSVQGLEITENNVASAQIVVGNGLGTISGITYWSGK